MAALCLSLSLTSCGVQRPLIRPKDIPAYEEQQRKKLERIEQEQREFDAKDAARKRVITPPEPKN